MARGGIKKIDGPVVKEAPAYGDDWWNIKVGNAVMLLRFTSNGDLNKQLEATKYHYRESRIYSTNDKKSGR